MARQVSVSRLTTPMKFAVGAALLVIVAVAYFVVFYGDLANSIQAAQQQERELRGRLTEARKLEFSYQKDMAELTERQQRQSELKKILPTETEYPSFLSALQGVANISGVSLVAWTPQPEVNAEFYSRVPMKLELEGRYHQVAKFFYGVGQLDRVINMENISLTRPTKQDGDYVESVSVLATAFRALAPKDASKNDKRRRGRAAGGKKR